MKNQMIIGDDPKYRQICTQGICSLEIRRPGNFDGGVYSCKAKNDHGEATVSCKLEVKREFSLKKQQQLFKSIYGCKICIEVVAFALPRTEF